MKKFQNKYRIPSARLQNWDYGSNGAYFITICTAMECFFGDVVNEMQLNQLGKIAHAIWAEIPNQFSYVELGNFVIIPNHMHGILIINKLKKNSVADMVETRLIASLYANGNTNKNVEKGGFAGENNPMLQENISRIIRWYKGRCSFEMRKIHAVFSWQNRFYDHIIRDSKAFDTIQNYIEENPSKWAKDKFHK